MASQQAQIVDFLSSPETFGVVDEVRVIETHGAYIFLCGDTALKLKRAVRYDYMDLSTVEKRRAILERELELNRPVAPEIYESVLPVTQERDGRLALDGAGDVVDWVIRMHRFPERDELVAIAQRGELDDQLAWNIGVALAGYHAAAPERRQPGAQLIADILDELGRFFADYSFNDGTVDASEWVELANKTLAQVEALLDKRGETGHVRRGHGDLHLRNLVLIGERPVPFDALEFDETLGTCDVLYDLGFLIMDLCHHNLQGAACQVLDAWLAEFRGSEDEGLAGLPLFLSVRAAIRSMVLMQTDAARKCQGQSAQETAQYLRQAHAFLAPASPVLIAVGGFSGTGKSVFARGVSPGLGAAPGAVVLSSDAIRKVGRDPASHLSFEAYTDGARQAVYDKMIERAHTILSAGHSVVLDATFLDPALRLAAEQVATDHGVPFSGFWLEAPRDVLTARVMARTGDQSDADLAVLERQLQRQVGVITWNRVDAARAPTQVLAEAQSKLPNGNSGPG